MEPGSCPPCSSGVCGDTDTSSGDDSDCEGDDCDECVGPECDDEGGSDGDDECFGDDCCNPDLSSDTGSCSNGNFPIFDIATGTINCDGSEEDINLLGGPDATLSACQNDADADPDDTDSAIEEAVGCCPASTAKRLFRNDLFGRQASGGQTSTCPSQPSMPFYEANPPQNGICHSTYTCDFAKWPNVCGNAASAIFARSRTSVLTYVPGSSLHVSDKFQYSVKWYLMRS